MNSILDTHFLLWIITGQDRLREFPWIDRYQPWGISPISLLEVQFLAEIGRIQVTNPELTNALGEDPRFLIDEVPIVPLVSKAMELTWTRDPFDRLLAAHSLVRRLPLCTTDRRLLRFHRIVPSELANWQ